MKYISVYNTNKKAIIDDKDFKKVSKSKWHIDIDGYARRSYMVNYDPETKIVKTTVQHMHRYIVDPPKGLLVDHINGNKLDNRRKNLRLCTRSQNQFNRGCTKNNKSGYKGVQFSKRDKIWSARIGFNRKKIELGTFKNPKDAAKAYNEAAKKYHGEFAFLNKI